jgi:hypothetical protein
MIVLRGGYLFCYFPQGGKYQSKAVLEMTGCQGIKKASIWQIDAFRRTGQKDHSANDK